MYKIALLLYFVLNSTLFLSQPTFAAFTSPTRNCFFHCADRVSIICRSRVPLLDLLNVM